jgi:hypothetical protein
LPEKLPPLRKPVLILPMILTTHVYKLFFECQIVGGSPRRTAESAESAFFSEENLPELSIGRVLPQQIRRFFQAVRSGKLETEYD